MILPEHPDNDPEVKGLKAIGYWRNDHHPDLPEPKDYVDRSWDSAERARVLAYLGAAEPILHWRGFSNCRICGIPNGSSCMSDGTYVWPEGFAHYLKDHGVRPPDEFLDHVYRRLETTKSMTGAEKVTYRFLYARHLEAMSLEMAKQILGLSPFGMPSRSEVMKAWKAKALEHHPDRGGDLNKMVQVNVAKDVLTGERPATPDETSTPQPKDPPKPVDPPLYEAASFDEAAKGSLSEVYWMWFTKFMNFDPGDGISRGALDTGWIAYGRTENNDHVFLPIGTGMYTLGGLSYGERETWWVGKKVVLSRKMPTSKAISSGMAKAAQQIPGLKPLSTIYTIGGRLGRRRISQGDLEKPGWSPTTIKAWLEDSGYGKQTPFKMTVELVKGSRGDWDKQVDIVINGQRNRLSAESLTDFLRQTGKKMFKKPELDFWKASRGISRLRDPSWAVKDIWRRYRMDLSQESRNALEDFARRLGVQEQLRKT